MIIKRRVRFAFILLLSLMLVIVGCSSGGGGGDAASDSGQDDNATEGNVSANPNQSQNEIKWRLQSTWPAGIEIQRQVEDFADKVREMSGGRLNIEVLPSGSVVEGLEVFDAVQNGVLDAGHAISSYWIAKEPAAPFFAAVPDGLTPIEYIMWLYYGDGIDLWQEMYADYNFGYVGPLGINNTETFAWSNKKIESLDDFKGLKFRTVGYWGEILTELGASVVTLPGGEVYGALETGVLDAAEFANPEADYVSGFHEVAKYAHVPGMHQPTSIMELTINKKAWDQLTPDLQHIVKEAAKAATLDGLGQTLAKDAQALKDIEASGTEIVELNPEIREEIRQKAKSLFEKISSEDPFIKKVYESQLKIREEFEYLQGFMNTRQ